MAAERRLLPFPHHEKRGPDPNGTLGTGSAGLAVGGAYLSVATGLDHLADEFGVARQDAPVDSTGGSDDLAVAAQYRVAEFQDQQVGPGARPDRGDRVERRAGRPFGMGLNQDQRRRGGRARHPSTAVHEEMSLRCFADLPAKDQEALDIFAGRSDLAGLRFDHIMKAQDQPPVRRELGKLGRVRRVPGCRRW